MNSVLDKMLDSIGIKDKNTRPRRDNRYYNDGYEVRTKKTSSTMSSRSDDDDEDYDVEKNGSTIEKVEDLVSQMFQACAVNMQGMFHDPSSPRSSSSGENRRRLKGGSGYNGATPAYDVLRASKSGLVSQRKRGTRSSSRRRRGISRARQRNHFPDDTPLPGNNKMMLYVNDDDDEVSALSAGTLEEMATRQQRLMLLQEANRKGAVARFHSYPSNNYNTTNFQNNGEHLGGIHPDELQNNMEDSKSFYSVSSANTTVFEGIWNKSPLQSTKSTRERVGIYEERGSILEEGGLDINCNPIPEELVEIENNSKSSFQTQIESDTPLSRKLKRHQVKSGMQFQAIDEDTSHAFSLQPDEQEI